MCVRELVGGVELSMSAVVSLAETWRPLIEHEGGLIAVGRTELKVLVDCRQTGKRQVRHTEERQTNERQVRQAGERGS